MSETNKPTSAATSPADEFPFKNSKMAEFLTKAFQDLPPTRTLVSIARKTGYVGPDPLLMFADGRARVALDKVPALAQALGVDPALLFGLAVAQYAPSLSEFVEKTFGRQVSVNEFNLVKTVRVLTHNADPEFGSAMAAKIVGAMRADSATSDRQ